MKGAIAAILIAFVVGVGGWFYLTELHATDIGKINSNPRDYVNKELTISGTVKERFSLFMVKYFILKETTGEITVVTDKPLPAVGARIRVKGYVEEGFSLGDQQYLVFIEKSNKQ